MFYEKPVNHNKKKNRSEMRKHLKTDYPINSLPGGGDLEGQPKILRNDINYLIIRTLNPNYAIM